MSKIIIKCKNCKELKNKHALQMCKSCYLKHRYKIVGQRPYKETKKWRVNNRERYIQLQRNYLNRRELELVMFLGGYICSDCGYNKNKFAIQIGHINNDGNIDRKRFKIKDQLIGYYLKHLDEAKQKLKMHCANCNTIQQVMRIRKR